MVLRRILCSIAICLFISCEDPMSILYPGKNNENSGTIKNYTNITSEGKGEFDDSQTFIVNNSNWSIEANIYKADSDKALLRTVDIDPSYSYYGLSTITIEYAPIYVELTGHYKDYIKANLNTKNYIYFLDK